MDLIQRFLNVITPTMKLVLAHSLLILTSVINGKITGCPNKNEKKCATFRFVARLGRRGNSNYSIVPGYFYF